jgi:signal transduction histidine kinase
MRKWHFNSIAGRIAVTIVLAMVLSGASVIALIFGARSWSERQQLRTDMGPHSFVTVNFGALDQYRNLPMAAARLATIAEIVGRTPPIDRPAVVAAISDVSLRVRVNDTPALDPTQNLDERLDRLRDVIEVALESPSGTAQVASRAHDKRLSDDAAAIDELQVEIRLPDGKWLAITTTDFVLGTVLPRGMTLAIIFAPFLLLVGLLSVWTARRLARPISAFATAAERFGMGAEAIPLAECGPQEIRTAIRAFNRMQERLRRFIEDRTLMVAAMSHDLKTPMTRLRLRAELIRNEPQQRKMLSDIEEMTAMIEATLTFVRDDTKREATLLVDLGALVESVCDNAMDAGGRVEVSARHGVHVICRPVAISRAVANLVDNGIKYGGCARVALESAGDRALITIDDDGPGIPEDQRENVFAPFYRLESSRNRDTGGVGLGLAVARTTVREHGGDVTMTAAESGGLRVRLELPVEAAGSPQRVGKGASAVAPMHEALAS